MAGDKDVKVVHNHVIQEGVSWYDVQSWEKYEVVTKETQLNGVHGASENSLKGRVYKIKFSLLRNTAAFSQNKMLMVLFLTERRN